MLLECNCIEIIFYKNCALLLYTFKVFNHFITKAFPFDQRRLLVSLQKPSHSPPNAMHIESCAVLFVHNLLCEPLAIVVPTHNKDALLVDWKCNRGSQICAIFDA